MEKQAIHDILQARQSEKYFRSQPTYSQPATKVDREAGILFGVQIVREGEAKGHGVMLDADFVNKITELGNGHKNGVKARFNHPNMSSGALGTMLGRFQNFRTEGNANYADLHLSETAKNSPSGDLYTYVLDMAQNEPDMFGNSISFQDDGELYVKNKDGQKLPIVYERLGMYDYTIKVNDNGELKDWNDDYSDEVYVMPAFLHASDLVDDPAATDGLFSAQVNQHAFAVQASDFLDANPEIWDFVERHPEKLIPFFEKYRAYSERKALKSTAPKMKKQSLLSRLFSALRGNSRFDIAITDTEGNQLSVVTDADAPAIGDEVLLLQDGQDPAPAPDGNYIPAEGEPNAGDTIVVAAGAIADIVPAEAEPLPNPPTDPVPDPVSMAALEAMRTQLAALEAENERLRNEPAARHTDPDEEEDFTRGNGKPDWSFNEPGKKAYEQGKKLATQRKKATTPA